MESTKLSKYLNSIKIKNADTDKDAKLKENNYRSQAKNNILKYLEWRGITIEELIQNGLKEKKFFKKYIEDDSLGTKKNSRIGRITHIKRILRFYKVPIQKWERKKQTIPYQKDKAMIDFLTFSGTKERTKISVNYYLRKYCEYRKLSPTELIEEANTISEKDLALLIKQFYDTLKLKSKRQLIITVIRFYKYLSTHRFLEVPGITNVKSKRKKRHNYDKILVDKELVRKIIEVSDLRDSMIVIALFESGMNPVDLMNLNYGDLKIYLNLDKPDDITEVALIPHEREKTEVEFLACFGPQSLQLISKWLKYVQKSIDLTDESPLFSMKKTPFERLKAVNYCLVLHTLSIKLGLNKKVNPSDFRNSFNTRTKPHLRHYDKELFLGHIGGIEAHYDISSFEYFVEEYRKVWHKLFDLSYDDVKYTELNERQDEQDTVIRHLEKKNKKLEQQLRKLNKKLEFTQEDVKEYHSFIDLVTKAIEKKKGTDFEDEITDIIHTIVQERG
ncbi:MAG: hypothetical protein GPJ52_02850 [Candidatus Heimdallarchaeota archaeon]|nr:hypothetical protein [Candidatus Heimdallarchaeota archaeon]